MCSTYTYTKNEAKLRLRDSGPEKLECARNGPCIALRPASLSLHPIDLLPTQPNVRKTHGIYHTGRMLRKPKTP